MIRKLAFPVLCALVAIGCGGGGGGGSSGGTTQTQTPSAQTGEGSISFTDAASDQITQFEVDVKAIDMVRTNGAVVSTLPRTARLDFAELVNESQCITAFSGLAGVYRGVNVTLDFSSAVVMLAGQQTPASIVDAAGQPVTGSVTFPVQFNGRSQVVIQPGLHNNVTIDFDLDQSMAIDLQANTVTLGPVLKATTTPIVSKVQNLAGVLASVDSATQSFKITLNRPGAPQAGPEFTVQTTSSTSFFVDGAVASFATLAAKPIGSVVAAQGQLSGATRTLTAASVECFKALDTVRGHVTARAADGTLTVVGAALDLTTSASNVSGALTLNQTYTVKAGTRVYQWGQQGALGSDAVGVGQRIVARGVLSGTTLDATTEGHVRLCETGFFGYATGPVSNGVLTINLARIGRRPVGAFDFTVGTTVTATPAAYAIGVGSLGLGSVTSGTPIAARGYASAWNAPAGAPDATAVTVVDRAAVASLLYVDWLVLQANPFTASSSSGVTIDVSKALRRFIDQGFVSPVRFGATDQPRIVAGSGPGLFVINQAGTITIHGDFASWQADWQGRLAAGSAKVRSVAAIGGWDAGTLTLTAREASVHLR